MSCTLDVRILEPIKAGDDADVILSTFDRIYDGIHYPPITAYRTMLFCSAVQFENDALVSRLMESGYDVNYSFGYVTPSPLNIAIQIGREDYVKQLLQLGASVNLENSASVTRMNDVYTALELAVKLDRWDLVQLMMPLYDRQKTRTHRTPLHLACLYGSRQCIEHILDTVEGQHDVNTRDCCDVHSPEGFSPLMLGVHHGAWLVEAVLKRGAHAEYITGRTHRSALHFACCPSITKSGEIHRFVSMDLPHVIQLLVKAGCSPDHDEKCGDTPLSLLMTQISQELNAQTTIAYPYEIEVHREIILNSVSTLIQMGANPNGHVKKIPISIVISQLISILRPVDNIICDSEVRDTFFQSAVSAACLARDLLHLLILNGASTKIFDVFGPSNALDCFLQIVIKNTGSWTDARRQYTTGILCTFADIFRILLLSNDGLFQSDLVFNLHFKQISCSELFISMLLNFCGRRNFEFLMNQFLKELQELNSIHLENFQSLIRKEPEPLKSLVRLKILQCFGNKALVRIPLLNLPVFLKEYISLK